MRSTEDRCPGPSRSPKRIGRKRAAGRPPSPLPPQYARDLRQQATAHERKLWRQLRLLRPAGLHFRRQVAVGNVIVDFACLKRRIVVELDGGQHSADLMVTKDQARDEMLARRGFRVLRFWNAELDENLDAVVETILAAMQGESDDRGQRIDVADALSPAPAPTPLGFAESALPSGEGD